MVKCVREGVCEDRQRACREGSELSGEQQSGRVVFCFNRTAITLSVAHNKLFGTTAAAPAASACVQPCLMYDRVPQMDRTAMVGVLSMKDVVRIVFEDEKHEIDSLKDYIHGGW